MTCTAPGTRPSASVVHGTRTGAATRNAVRIEAHGTEPDGVVADVGRLYAGTGWSAHTTDRPFTYRYTAVGDTAITLRRSCIDGAIRGVVPRTEDYVVQWITTGRAVPDVRLDRVPLTPGVPMLFPTEREFEFAYEDYDQRLVHLSRALVRDVAEERSMVEDDAPLVLDHLRPVGPAAVLRWREQLSLLARELRSGPGTLLWQTLTRGAASAFLDLYPPEIATLPPSLLHPRKARSRAAVEFIQAHAHEPLTVADIARAAGLSVRSVQERFAHDVGQTPMGYLLGVRLERVRDELRLAHPSATTIGEVARRWGFAHLGRFSGAYRRAFGEYPRDTMHH